MATCSVCGTAATGNFCSACGAPLTSRPCHTCGDTPEPGARFCNSCGSPQATVAASVRTPPGATPAMPRTAPTGAGARPRVKRAGASASAAEPPSRFSQQVGWLAGGAFVLGLILILALPILRREEAPGAMGPTGTGTPPDIANMSPREAADRLFDRVMRADAAGDVNEAQTFLPMAIAAHDRARPLDLDGLFHLALLHQTGADHAAAMTVAGEILARDPDYLLGLAVAAESSGAMGDSAAALDYHTRFLDAYDAQIALGLEEYGIHTPTLDAAQASARRATGR